MFKRATAAAKKIVSKLAKKVARSFKSRGKTQKFTNKTVCVKFVWHPGIKAQPYMRPALERGKEFIDKFLAQRVTTAINRKQDAQQAMAIVCKQAAGIVRVEAVRLAPVRKGGLRRSITIQIVGPTTYRVGTNIRYGPYVEFGTGLHGPKKRKYKIVPRFKKCLAFTVRVPRPAAKTKRGGRGRRGQ